MTVPAVSSSTRGRFIPWVIVLFFAVLTALFAAFIYVAEQTYTGVVTEQAYEKGLAYNTTIDKADAQNQRELKATLSREKDQIVFFLKDASGRNVAKGAVLWFFRPVHDGKDKVITMQRRLDGAFIAPAVVPEQGLWELRIRAETSHGSYQMSKRMVFE